MKHGVLSSPLIDIGKTSSNFMNFVIILNFMFIRLKVHKLQKSQ